ncbi:uncharacterized protein [Ambystoma mexicanum]|uniref:uncharacterized protein n=1 Tax=Ambystoma mexicanum TaxID=8296 RepID=UPI0037E99322
MAVLAFLLPGFLALLLLCIGLRTQPVVVDYNISLYSPQLQMASIIWLAPASCFYEAWLMNTPNPTLANRSTSVIAIEVDPSDANNTLFQAQKRYSVPRCNPLYPEPPDTNNFVYQVGPDLDSLDFASVISVAAGKHYRIRLSLHSGANSIVGVTNWSAPIQTRALPLSARDMGAWLEGRSGGMVVITVILSISMLLLLVGLGFAFGSSQR